MAVLGVATCGILAATGSAVLFARLTRHTDRPLLAALTGAFFWVADIASGRITFALGALTALAALVLLPRLRWAIPCAVLTALLSPVAAAFLGLVAAVLVLRRRPGGWVLGVATTVPVLVVTLLFPGGGIQPMSPGSAVPAVLAALALAVVTTEPLVRTGALLYGAAVLVLLAHDDPFGSNVLRLGLLLALPLLLATATRRTWVVLVLSLYCLNWQLDPLIGDLRAPAPMSFAALDQHLTEVGAKRVEVVAGRDHREAADVVRAVALARGWARQIDVRDNPLFYRSQPLHQAEYVGWLRSHAVDHVAVPRRGPADWGGVLETKLLRSPVAGLMREWEDADWIVYRVVSPRPVVSAPGVLLSYDRARLVIRSAAAGSVDVDVRWSRWLSVSGPACVSRRGDRVAVRFATAGTVVLTSSLQTTRHCA